MTTSTRTLLDIDPHGRSVYASFDGLCVTLQRTDGQRITLDPDTLVALLRYVETKAGKSLDAFTREVEADAAALRHAREE